MYIYDTKPLEPITEKNGTVFMCINTYTHVYVCVHIPKALNNFQKYSRICKRFWTSFPVRSKITWPF